MSRIDELIAELVPDGVRYLPIDKLFHLRNGYTPSKSNAEFWSGGTIPWFRMEDIRASGGVLSNALQRIPEVAVKGGELFPANSLLVATSATIGEHALVTVPHLSNQRFTSLTVKAEYADQVDMKFFYYYGFVLDEWCRNNTTTSSFSSVDMSGFKKFKFPMPPLEVQREIVRILDQFTQLEAELEAELEARRRQFGFYRDSLLAFREVDSPPLERFRWTTLAEVARLRNGRDYKHLGVGPVPVYGSGGVIASVDQPAFTRPSVLIPRKGSLGNLFYVDGPFWTVDTIFWTEVDEDLMVPRYLFHYLTTLDLPALNTAGGVPSLTQSVLNKIPIPVPSLESQAEVVELLDQFDALVNDLSVGLPAELTARRKQYEYYRDKLLTFEEAV